MVRWIISFILLILFIASCATGNGDCDLIIRREPVPKETVKVYNLFIHSNTQSHKISPILAAAAEWATVAQGTFLFEVSYGTFDITAAPALGEIRIYIGPDSDPESHVVGACAWWGTDKLGPNRSIIRIQNDLDDRSHYLVALHEIGHALGVAHSASASSIMFPTLTDTGDHVPCQDIISVCKIWGCTPPICQ